MNKHLSTARRVNNDEFYTSYSDIAAEISHYTSSLAGKIVYCMVSNSNTSFITDLYSGFNIEAVEAKKRMVNRDGKGHTGKTELIITNYNKIK